ncbi:MAG: DUF3006 domain-containing protein [bacterium]|nr:DUF3006 domain-containing protein [bacterium]
MPLIIDRFEENYAVCEGDGTPVLLPRASLPPSAAEGDVLTTTKDGGFAVDAARTAMRKKEAQQSLLALLSAKKE